MDAKPKHRRRWYQISLRSLLLLVTLASCGFGLLGLKLRQAKQQKEDVEAIQNLGGKVLYDFEIDAQGKSIQMAAPPGPAWLRNWAGIDFYAHVSRVECFGPAFTDDRLEHLRRFSRLKTLFLYDTRLTDVGVSHLQDLTQLESLSLCNSPVTDAGLTHLRRLTRLEFLYLIGTQISDAGLHNLHGLTQLKFLNLNGTQVTEQGYQDLEHILPNATIHR